MSTAHVMEMVCSLLIFFFKQKTAYEMRISDWSSDVCSSDLMEVRTCLYTRAAVEKLGIAPLTSMFLYGENSQRPADDLRPEVHDSDGMLLATGRGEWIWRPLTNRASLQISSFGDQNPREIGRAHV